MGIRQELYDVDQSMLGLVRKIILKDNPLSVDERIDDAKLVVDDRRKLPRGDKVVYVNGEGDWVRMDLPSGDELVGAYGFGITKSLEGGYIHKYATKSGMILENTPWTWWNVLYPNGEKVFESDHHSVLAMGQDVYGINLDLRGSGSFDSVERAGKKVRGYVAENYRSDLVSALSDLANRKEHLLESL